MKLGILSDTHAKVGRAKEIVLLFLEHKVDFIVHAGDIGEVETLELLKNSGVRYIAVYGNNDAHLAIHHRNYNLVQEPHYFKIAGTKCKLMHLPYYMTPDTEVVLFGHTHEFSVEFTANGTLYLNPGEACARNKPLSECAILEITDTAFEVAYFFKGAKENHFGRKDFSYKRIQSK
jgi:putative phosphoesterase